MSSSNNLRFTMPESRPTSAPRYVVGIGASAGGLDALERFFEQVPRDAGMAYVVVQHLSPDFKSLMDELLARHTQLPILLVQNGMPVEPDHVYLIPPKKEMIISGGRLLLSERDRQQELTLPIDVFFRSLAQDCGARAVAIVLSGSGSDGSRGIRDVHEAGGLVMVQDLESAQFDGMPRTARDAGVAHWVLPPQEMPRVLLQHATSPLAGRAHPANGENAAEPEGLAAVYRMLQDEFGLDFTHYKPSTVTRRIERRLALTAANTIEEYVERLRQERDELDVLYRDLLIGVTHFFRDEPVFSALEQKVLPELLRRGPRDQPLRIWVAGCATGEEAYSLAILLQDLMLKHGERPVKIFATDVHRGSLERAGRAIYGEEAVANVSPDRLARYFLRTGDSYQVVPDIRQMVVFAQHDVIKSPPFTRVDLITCRNLLIYLQPAAQQKVLSLFHFALNRGGVLCLGPSETVGPFGRDFESIDQNWRLYRKHSDVRIPVDARLQPGLHGEARAVASLASLQPAAPRYSLSQLLGTYDALLEEVMPPGLLVNDRGELIHAFSGASRFLKARDGRQGLEIGELVEGELKMVLAAGLKRALHEPSALVFKGVRIELAAEAGSYTVTIRRIRSRAGSESHLLISIDPQESIPRPPPPPETEIDLDQVSREQLKVLEVELGHTKENLQAAIEKLEASNEELQASNEELQASNEELQSTNEELQSVNEELYTVNAEYQRKITELTELTNDMDNLLSSTEVGTIFLDSNLMIRKFTPQVAETFNLVPHDVGRPIETFAHKMDHPELVDDLKQVLTTSRPVERELRGVRGKSFFLRILPYRVKGAADGVVITLIDVSGLKAAEDALFHERYLLNSLLLNVPDAIYFKDARGRFIRANQAMAARLGLTDPAEATGKTALEVPDQEAALALHREDEAVLRSGQAQHYRLEKRTRADGSHEWDLVTRLPLKDADDRVVGIIVIFRNVTEQQRAEEKIQEAVRRRDQFLAMLSHELRNPLGAIVTATSMMKNQTPKNQTTKGQTSTKAAPADQAPEGPVADRLLEVVDRQSQQMTRLLDDLLEASRVTQNKIDLKTRVIDLRTVIKDAAEAVRDQMKSRGIGFTEEIGSEPLAVEGDPARLQQIQVNLLHNAAKYTPRGGEVVLSATREENEALICVRDDGAGIAPDMLEPVFDLFVQSGRTLDRSGGGLGVGLTLVRSLVTMHGGTVSAHSEGEGRGSEFRVRLPLVAKAAEPEAVGVGPRRQVVDGAKIILVEDNEDSRELLCELLTGAGFECHSADSGVSGLALVDQIRPDIVILDVGLPGMDGFEIARRIRRDPRHADACLIALTGYGQAADRAAAKEAGFDEHLVKPVHCDQLLALLSELQRNPPRAARAAQAAAS
jgi:two-component system CheB/CheR fusion protein